MRRQAARVLRTGAPGLAVVLLALAGPGPVDGQIGGRVVDDRGRPVPGARVELRDGGEVLAVRLADEAGRFDLPAEPGGDSVRATRLGFAPARGSLGDVSRPLELVLEPRPLELEGLQARTRAPRCPTVHDPEARRAWLAEIRRVRQPSTDVVWSAPIVERRTASGVGGRFGPFRAPEPTWAEAGDSGRQLALWVDGASGDLRLARRREPEDLGGPGSAWRFPALDGPGAPFLFDPALARRAVVAWAEAGSTVLLCDRDVEGTELLLQAALDAEPGIREIRWRIRTPEPVEEAGGWLTFPAEPGTGSLPLPRSVYLWTRAFDHRTSQELRIYGPWFVGSPDEVRRAIRDWHERRGRRDTP